MRRQYMSFTVTGVILSLLFSLSVAVAPPAGRSLRQAHQESEPNNTLEDADPFQDYIVGQVSNSPMEESTDFHYFSIQALPVSATTVKTADYRLEICQVAGTPTPTPPSSDPIIFLPIVLRSYSPYSTPTPPPTPGFPQDRYEPNDDLAHAYALPPATSIDLGFLTFSPLSDEDWFLLWAKNGQRWRCWTGDLMDVDTTLGVYDLDEQLIAWDDDGGGGFASDVSWVAQYDGYHALQAANLVDTLGAYDLSCRLTWGPVRVGTAPPYPPFEYLDDQGHIAGFDVDLMKAIAREAAFEVEFVNTRWQI